MLKFHSHKQATPVVSYAYWGSAKEALIKSIRKRVFFEGTPTALEGQEHRESGLPVGPFYGYHNI